MKKALQTAGLALLFLIGALVVALTSGAAVFGVPTSDVLDIAVLLAGAGGGVGVLALLLVRPAVMGRLGGVRAQLVGSGLIGSMLLLVMILAAAQAMFISGHDLALLLTMLLFAAVLCIGFSLLCAAPMASRIERVRQGAARISEGDLDSTIPADGHDEIAGLADDFNRMARSLKGSSEREHDMEKARRDLIASVSHDLRTPLTATRALIEALADGVADTPETESRYLDSARRELTHLSRLVDDLFELARIDAGVMKLELEQASLHDLISDTLSTFQPQARQQGVHLVGEVSGGVDPVLMNPPRLQRVLYNLISNALRHTPSNGTISLRAEPRGEVVQVEIADTGEGIAAEDLPRVFDRSFRGEISRTRKETAKDAGAGLGLAIARGLIEAHGGEISAESPLHGGASFRFTLRRA